MKNETSQLEILERFYLDIEKETDIVFFWNKVKQLSEKIHIGVVKQTKLTTAGSELFRNMIKYAKNGKIILEIVEQSGQQGIRLTFKDNGPGIKDIDQAMQEGYSSDQGYGLGLPVARKLSDKFEIDSTPGEGTTVKILMWKHGI